MCMVENFTTNEDLAYIDIEEYNKQDTEEQFEEKLNATFKKIAKAPSSHVIDKILAYSRSLSK